VQIREEQQGFRKNRSTTDAIFTLKQIKEKAIEYNRIAYACFIDLTKAFDRIQLSDVTQILTNKGIDGRIINLIKEINTNGNTMVRCNGELSKMIKTDIGVRQGDSLSPFLFNIVMDRIIEEVSSLNLGYKLGEQTITTICYADDAVILAECEDDLQVLLHKFHTISLTYNMQISITKTKCMTFSKEPVRCKLALDNKTIEQVSEFKYLGVNVLSHSDVFEEVKNQATRASVVSGCLKDVIWSNKDMQLKSKVRIYKTCVRPILTYGIETRADTVRTKSLLRTTEMKTLRKIAGKTLRDRVRNDKIREMCDVQDVVRWGRQRRRFWRDHVNRMDSQRLPHLALHGKPDGKRAPGRPPKRWKDSWESTSQEANSAQTGPRGLQPE
jgi:hypothetical protein